MCAHLMFGNVWKNNLPLHFADAASIIFATAAPKNDFNSGVTCISGRQYYIIIGIYYNKHNERDYNLYIRGRRNNLFNNQIKHDKVIIN